MNASKGVASMRGANKHLNELSSALESFQAQETFCDVFFHSKDDLQISVHRHLLKPISPNLLAPFLHSKDPVHFIVPHIHSQELLALISILYTGTATFTRSKQFHEMVEQLGISLRKGSIVLQSAEREERLDDGRLSCGKCERKFFMQAALNVHQKKCSKQKKSHKSFSSSIIKTISATLDNNSMKRSSDAVNGNVKKRFRKDDSEMEVLLDESKDPLDVTTCDICQAKLRNGEDLEEHQERCLKTKMQPDTYQCKGCGKQFHLRISLKKHKQVCKKMKTIVPVIAQTKSKACENCGKIFQFGKSLAKHRSQCNLKYKEVEIGGGEGDFKCGNCEKAFLHETSVLRHFKSCNICYLCKKVSLSTENSLFYHLTTHFKEPMLKSFGLQESEIDKVCPICNKVYTRKWIILKHIAQDHLALQPYLPDFLAQRFFKKGDSSILSNQNSYLGDANEHSIPLDQASFLNPSHDPMLGTSMDGLNDQFLPDQMSSILPNSSKVEKVEVNVDVVGMVDDESMKDEDQNLKEAMEGTCFICKRYLPTKRRLKKHLLHHWVGDKDMDKVCCIDKLNKSNTLEAERPDCVVQYLLNRKCEDHCIGDEDPLIIKQEMLDSADVAEKMETNLSNQKVLNVSNDLEKIDSEEKSTKNDAENGNLNSTASESVDKTPDQSEVNVHPIKVSTSVHVTDSQNKEIPTETQNAEKDDGENADLENLPANEERTQEMSRIEEKVDEALSDSKDPLNISTDGGNEVAEPKKSEELQEGNGLVQNIDVSATEVALPDKAPVQCDAETSVVSEITLSAKSAKNEDVNSAPKRNEVMEDLVQQNKSEGEKAQNDQKDMEMVETEDRNDKEELKDEEARTQTNKDQSNKTEEGEKNQNDQKDVEMVETKNDIEELKDEDAETATNKDVKNMSEEGEKDKYVKKDVEMSEIKVSDEQHVKDEANTAIDEGQQNKSEEEEKNQHDQEDVKMVETEAGNEKNEEAQTAINSGKGHLEMQETVVGQSAQIQNKGETREGSNDDLKPLDSGERLGLEKGHSGKYVDVGDSALGKTSAAEVSSYTEKSQDLSNQDKLTDDSCLKANKVDSSDNFPCINADEETLESSKREQKKMEIIEDISPAGQSSNPDNQFGDKANNVEETSDKMDQGEEVLDSDLPKDIEKIDLQKINEGTELGILRREESDHSKPETKTEVLKFENQFTEPMDMEQNLFSNEKTDKTPEIPDTIMTNQEEREKPEETEKVQLEKTDDLGVFTKPLDLEKTAAELEENSTLKIKHNVEENMGKEERSNCEEDPKLEKSDLEKTKARECYLCNMSFSGDTELKEHLCSTHFAKSLTPLPLDDGKAMVDCANCGKALMRSWLPTHIGMVHDGLKDKLPDKVREWLFKEEVPPPSDMETN